LRPTWPTPSRSASRQNTRGLTKLRRNKKRHLTELNVKIKKPSRFSHFDSTFSFVFWDVKLETVEISETMKWILKSALQRMKKSKSVQCSILIELKCLKNDLWRKPIGIWT
jgi:hypothetical protein